MCVFVYAQRDSYCNLVGMYELSTIQQQQQQQRQTVSLTNTPRAALQSISSANYSRVLFGIKQFDMVIIYIYILFIYKQKKNIYTLKS